MPFSIGDSPFSTTQTGTAFGLSQESLNRLMPVTFERNQFLTKTDMGPATAQGITEGILSQQKDQERFGQQILQQQKALQVEKDLRQQEINIENKRLKEQITSRKHQESAQLWGGVGQMLGTVATFGLK